jgi:apolipoprotein N-acyltransferase
VALLQGNIPQDEKFIPGGGVATALRWYGEQLRDARAPLVITPETAVPLLPSQLPPGYTAFGTIDEEGLKTLDKIGTAGVADGSSDGAPKQAVQIKSILLD